MSTNKSYDEPARLKSRLPAALISVAACAAIIVCAAAVGLRGRDSSEELVTESRTEVTPGAQVSAGGTEDGNTEKSYPEKEKIGSITIPNFMETQDIYSETAFEEYRDNGKNFFTVVADKSFDEYKSFDENNEVIALYAPSSMKNLKDIEQVRKSPVIELSDIDGSIRKYVIVSYLDDKPSLGSEPDYIPDDLQTWTDKCGVYTSNVSFTSDDEYLSILFFPENDMERNYIIARKIKDDEDIEAISSSYRLLSDSSDTNAVTTVTEVTTSVTTTAVPITYPEETDVTTVTAVIPDESETEQLVTVPSVVGMTQAEAIAELKRAGLNYVISDTFSDEAVGTVIEQSIDGKEQVLKGTEVMIYVSAGKEENTESGTDDEDTVIMPNVIGMQESDASAELKKLGIICGHRRERSDEPEKTVIKQAVAAGERVKKNTTVWITYSSGSLSGPVPVDFELPLPEGVTGSITIDIYLYGESIYNNGGGAPAYTKTINNCEEYAGGNVSLEICGERTANLAIYIRNNDIGSPNNIHYADYSIDFENKTYELISEVHADALLRANQQKR